MALEPKTMDELVVYMKRCKNIVVMSGAGISTSAGIPDFRSPGSGLFASVHKEYGLTPRALFDIEYFQKDPKPFYMLAKELFPTIREPTPAHCFIKLLHDKGVLLRNYTQNIDGLERQAAIPADKVVEAHGTICTSHCLTPSCKQEYSLEWMKEKLCVENVDVPLCPKCNGVIKPDLVFFGEDLSKRFYECEATDFANCDLLIIMGTSLQVQPFASLMNRVSDDTPRVLINREKIEEHGRNDIVEDQADQEELDSESEEFSDDDDDIEMDFGRDVAIIADCDDGVMQLARFLGWEDELTKLRQYILSTSNLVL